MTAALVDAEALIANLTQQRTGYAALLGLARRQFEALRSGGSDDLSSLILEQDDRIATLAGLERARLALLEGIATAWGRGGDTITASDLVAVLSPDAATQVAREATGLVETLASLSAINEQNAQLLGSALRIQERWRQHFLRGLVKAETYAANGAAAPLRDAVAFDRAA